MNYANTMNQKYYVALKNGSFAQGIKVNVKILAVKVDNTYQTISEKIPIYTNTNVPVNQD